MNIYTENEITSWIVCFLCFFLFLVLSKSDMQRKGTAERFSQKAPQSKADIWALNHSMISPPCVSHPARLLHVLDPHPPEDQVDHAFLLLMGRQWAHRQCCMHGTWDCVFRQRLIFPLITCTEDGLAGKELLWVCLVWSHHKDFTGVTEGNERWDVCGLIYFNDLLEQFCFFIINIVWVKKHFTFTALCKTNCSILKCI